MDNSLLPVFLKTEKARFLIVGGGRIGLEKIQTLVQQTACPSIQVVSTVVSDDFRKFAQAHPHIHIKERAFQESDLQDMDFVIAATNDKAVNSLIKEQANQRHILVNAVDQPELCDFYFGSIVNKGFLKIAISTNGKAPIISRRLREFFSETIPDHIHDHIDQLASLKSRLKGDFQTRLSVLDQATSSLSLQYTTLPQTHLENGVELQEQGESKKFQKLVLQMVVLFAVFFIGYGLSNLVSVNELKTYASQIPPTIFAIFLVGFFAQLVDGALGLGYGVTSTTSMMIMGIPITSISGSVHTAEMFSSAMSGYSHYRFGNVNKKMLFWLAVPGVMGAVIGALALIYLGNKYEKITYVILASYTMLIGIRLLILAFKKIRERQAVKHLGTLGFTGGFFDSFGGGGWGPIVTSTLLSKGKKANYVIGTVSLSEFFVTLAAAITFFTALGVSHWYIIVGLIAGGAVAAPIGARLAGKLPQRLGMFLVALLVITFSVRMLFKSQFFI